MGGENCDMVRGLVQGARLYEAHDNTVYVLFVISPMAAII